jgi:hypothetical protein
MPAAAPATWEEVLAAFEVSTAQAEAVLADDPDAAPSVIPAAFDVWKLNLPQLPADLRSRAEAIQRRQAVLIEALKASMASVQQQISLSDAGVEPRRSLYVDQLA